MAKQKILEDIEFTELNPDTGELSTPELPDIQFDDSPFETIPGLDIPVDRGVIYEPGMTQSDIAEKLVDTQDNWERAGNALIQGVVNESVLSGAENLSYLLDLPGVYNSVTGSEQEFGNWFGDIMKDWKESVRESNPIYADPSGDIGSKGWFWSNVPSVMSSLGFILPVGAANLPIKALASSIKGLNNASKTAKVLRAAGVGNSALAARHMESTMEASGVYEKAYNDAISGRKLVKGLSEEEANRSVKEEMESSDLYKDITSLQTTLQNNILTPLDPENPESIRAHQEREEQLDNLKLLQNQYISSYNSKVSQLMEDQVMTPEKAKKYAADAANTNYRANSAMLLQDIVEWSFLTKGGKNILSAISKNKINKALAQQGVTQLEGAGLSNVAKEMFDPKALLSVGASEGAEEFYQSLATDLSIWNADRKYDVVMEDEKFTDAFKKAATSSEAITSTLFGALGGIMMGTAGKTLNDYVDKGVDNKIEEIKNWGVTFDAINEAREKKVKEGKEDEANYLQSLMSSNAAVTSAMNGNTDHAINFFEQQLERLSVVPENETQEEKEIREDDIKVTESHIENFKSIKDIYNEEVGKDEELAPLITQYQSTLNSLNSYKEDLNKSIDKHQNNFALAEELTGTVRELYDLGVDIKANEKLSKNIKEAIKANVIPEDKKDLVNSEIKTLEAAINKAKESMKEILNNDTRDAEQVKEENKIIQNALISNDKLNDDKYELAQVDYNLKYIGDKITEVKDPKKASKLKQKIADNKIAKEERRIKKEQEEEIEDLNNEMQEVIETSTSLDELRDKYDEIDTKVTELNKKGLSEDIDKQVVQKLKELKRQEKEFVEKDVARVKSVDEFKKGFEKANIPLKELKELKRRIDEKEETRTLPQTEALNQVIREKETGEKIFNLPQRLSDFDVSTINPKTLKRINKLLEAGNLKAVDKILKKEEEKVEKTPSKQPSPEALELANTYSPKEIETLVKAQNRSNRENNPEFIKQAMEQVASDKENAFNPDLLEYLDEAFPLALKNDIVDTSSKYIEEEETLKKGVPYEFKEIYPEIPEDLFADLDTSSITEEQALNLFKGSQPLSEEVKVEPITNHVNIEDGNSPVEDTSNEESNTTNLDDVIEEGNEKIEEPSKEDEDIVSNMFQAFQESTPIFVEEETIDQSVEQEKSVEENGDLEEANILKINPKGKLITDNQGNPSMYVFYTEQGNPISINFDLLDSGEVQVGSEVTFELQESKQFLEQFDNGGFKDTDGKVVTDKWKVAPIFIKYGDEYIGVLASHFKDSSKNFNRENLYKSLSEGKEVKSNISNINVGSINSSVDSNGIAINKNLQDTYNKEDIVLAIGVGNKTNPATLDRYDFGNLTEELTSKIESDATTYTPNIMGGVSIWIKSNDGIYRPQSVTTKKLTPSTIDKVISYMKEGNVEDAGHIVSTESYVDMLVKFPENTDKFIQYGKNYLSFYSPSTKRIVQIHKDQLTKALNNEDSVFKFVEPVQGEEYLSLEELKVPKAEKDKLKNSGLENELRAFLSNKRFQVDVSRINSDKIYDSRITGKEYNSYLDYLISEEEISDGKTSENIKTNAILMTDVVKLGNSLHYNFNLKTGSIVTTESKNEEKIEENKIDNSVNATMGKFGDTIIPDSNIDLVVKESTIKFINDSKLSEEEKNQYLSKIDELTELSEIGSLMQEITNKNCKS